jgi:hypothetical protein
VVVACGGDLQGAAGSGLALDVAEVEGNPIRGSRVAPGQGEGTGVAEVIEDLREVGGHEALDPGERGGLGAVVRGDDHAPESPLARCHHLGERPRDAAQLAPEGELAEQQGAFEALGRELAEGRHRGGGDGEVEGAADLAEVARSEVDDDAVFVEEHAGAEEGRADADPALADGSLGEPYQIEAAGATESLDLDVDEVCLHAQ